MNVVKNTDKYLLIKELKAIQNTSRESRKKVTKKVLNDQSLFESLTEIAFTYDNELSVKALLVLELVAEQRLDWIAYNLNYFTANLVKLEDESAIKSAAKICNLIAQDYNSKYDSPIKLIITQDQISQIIETCFEWLSRDYKTGTKTHTLETLFYLGKKISWIHYELKLIFDLKASIENTSFNSKAKKLLDSISNNTAA